VLEAGYDSELRHQGEKNISVLKETRHDSEHIHRCGKRKSLKGRCCGGGGQAKRFEECTTNSKWGTDCTGMDRNLSDHAEVLGTYARRGREGENFNINIINTKGQSLQRG